MFLLLMKHLKASSPTYEHQSTTDHITYLDNFTIIAREVANIARAIKEAIYMSVNNPILTRNIGKYNLPHNWDKFLISIPELKINK